MSTYSERLKKARKHAGLTQAELAQRVGIDQTSVSNLERGKSQSTSYNASIASVCGVNALWLENGSGEMLASNGTIVSLAEASERTSEATYLGQVDGWDDSTSLAADDAELPLFREVQMAAGSGRSTVQPVYGRKLRFSYATLRAAGVDPGAAICTQLVGKSMEPLIMDGSTIGVDTSSTQIIDGEIYALEHDGMLRVKFVYRLPGGGIRLRSFNREEFEDEEYTSDQLREQNLTVLGWVFWWSTVRHKGRPRLV
ncbi:helix-turn-helix transcriptional regulator [Pseudomonas sp. YH-1]|uniref:LexA family transcriptional regulator n=1 Tax=Pseudomonas sp. YH-1 TaxID=3384787 RepID=UPI003F7CDAA8